MNVREGFQTHGIAIAVCLGWVEAIWPNVYRSVAAVIVTGMI
jgi:hypothetical protein